MRIRRPDGDDGAIVEGKVTDRSLSVDDRGIRCEKFER